MEPEKAVRVRVLRILAGKAAANDIDAIFADLRFLPGCPREVRDLADFAAHRHDRDRGFALDTGDQLLASLNDYLSRRVPSWSAAVQYGDASTVTVLKAFLLSRSILAADELADPTPLTRPVGLYALSTMHGCQLKLSTTEMAELSIRDGGGGTLEIGCRARMPTMPQLWVNLCVFRTSIAVDRAQGRLGAELPPSDPAITVERMPDGTLRYLE